MICATEPLHRAIGNGTMTGGIGADLFDFGFALSEGGIDRISLQGWGTQFGTSLTLENRPNGSSALVPSGGDVIVLRGVSVALFDVDDLTL